MPVCFLNLTHALLLILCLLCLPVYDLKFLNSFCLSNEQEKIKAKNSINQRNFNHCLVHILMFGFGVCYSNLWDLSENYSSAFIHRERGSSLDHWRPKSLLNQ